MNKKSIKHFYNKGHFKEQTIQDAFDKCKNIQIVCLSYFPQKIKGKLSTFYDDFQDCLNKNHFNPKGTTFTDLCFICAQLKMLKNILNDRIKTYNKKLEKLENNNLQKPISSTELKDKYKQNKRKATNDISEKEDELKHKTNEINNLKELKEELERSNDSLKDELEIKETKLNLANNKLRDTKSDLENKEFRIQNLNVLYQNTNANLLAEQELTKSHKLEILNLEEKIANLTNSLDKTKAEKSALIFDIKKEIDSFFDNFDKKHQYFERWALLNVRVLKEALIYTNFVKTVDNIQTLLYISLYGLKNNQSVATGEKNNFYNPYLEFINTLKSFMLKNDESPDIVEKFDTFLFKEGLLSKEEEEKIQFYSTKMQAQAMEKLQNLIPFMLKNGENLEFVDKLRSYLTIVKAMEEGDMILNKEEIIMDMINKKDIIKEKLKYWSERAKVEGILPVEDQVPVDNRQNIDAENKVEKPVINEVKNLNNFTNVIGRLKEFFINKK